MNYTYKIINEDEIKNKFEDLYSIELNSNGDPYSKETFKEILEHATNTNFVCFDGDVPVGIASWNEASKKFNGSIYMVNISVRTENQRQGIASKLIQMAIDYYCKKNLDKPFTLEVDKTNIPAFNLYKKMGFEIDETYQDDEQFGMVKPLDLSIEKK